MAKKVNPKLPKRVSEQNIHWGKARKKPVEIEYREAQPVNGVIEIIKTDGQGDEIAVVGRDFIIRGVEGEIYPIKKEVFYKTYDVIRTPDGHVNKGYHDVEEFYKDD